MMACNLRLFVHSSKFILAEKKVRKCFKISDIHVDQLILAPIFRFGDVFGVKNLALSVS